MEIKKGNAPPVHSNIFATIYGDPGTRKTSFAITAEEPLLLDFDQRGHRAYDGDRAGRIDVTEFDDIAEAAQKYKGKYKTLVIDTVGRALDLKTQEIVRVSKTTPGLKAHNQFGGLSLPGYGILKSAFYGACQDIRASGMDVVFVAHGRRIKEEDRTIWEPDIVGSSADEVYKASDLMGLMSPIAGRTVLRLNPSELWQAKNPIGASSIPLDYKDKDGWEVTLADLLERCRSKVTSVPKVAKLEILDEIKAVDNIEAARDILEKILHLDGAERDMAASAFKARRSELGFKYSKDKGVYK